jgi:hypothetical protein
MKGIHASGSTRDKTSPNTNQQSKIIQLSSNVNIIRNLKENVDGVKTNVKRARIGCCNWAASYAVALHGRKKVL